jgi:hypothetical protein
LGGSLQDLFLEKKRALCKRQWHGTKKSNGTALSCFFLAFLLAFELYQYIASSQFTAIEGD